MAVYALLAEDYTADYDTLDEKRMVKLKTGEWIRASEIVKISDEDALSAIGFYQRYKRKGISYGSWALNSEGLVEVVDILEPLDRFYHPKVTI